MTRLHTYDALIDAIIRLTRAPWDAWPGSLDDPADRETYFGDYELLSFRVDDAANPCRPHCRSFDGYSGRVEARYERSGLPGNTIEVSRPATSGVSMASRYETMQIGDDEVLVQVIQLPGSQHTSAASRVRDAFADTQQLIAAVAAQTLNAVNGIAVRPDKFEVEFGIGFSVKSNVLVAAGSADATLKVKLTYEAHP